MRSYWNDPNTSEGYVPIFHSKDESHHDQSKEEKRTTTTVGVYASGLSVSNTSTSYVKKDNQHDRFKEDSLCEDWNYGGGSCQEFADIGTGTITVDFTGRYSSASGDTPSEHEEGERVVIRPFGTVPTPLPPTPHPATPAAPRELTREEINASIAAGTLHNEQFDSWWWAGTKSFVGSPFTPGHYADSLRIGGAELAYAADTATLGLTGVDQVGQHLLDAAGIDEGLQIAPKFVGRAGGGVGLALGGVAAAGVDILVRQDDLPALIAAMTDAGFYHRQTAGLDMFVEEPDASVRDGVHVLISGRAERAGEPNPDVEPNTRTNDFQTVELPQLVRMKLNTFRRKDQVHLLDMISLGMIDESWLAQYPDKLRLRLKELLDDPDG